MNDGAKTGTFTYNTIEYVKETLQKYVEIDDKILQA